MDKQEFYAKQKEILTNRYQELKKEKKRRDTILEIMSLENNLAPKTISAIIFTKSYRKPKTVPKQQNQA